MDLNGLKEIVKDLTQGAEARAVSRALKCYSKGQLDRAIEILVEARHESPDHADILFDLCRYQIYANRGTEGAETLRSALRRHPRSYQRATEMIEELRARHANVSPLFDAVAEHFIRQDDFKSALEALERMKPEEIRAFVPRHQSKWDGLRKSAPDAKMAKTSLHSAFYLALCHEALREYEPAATIYRLIARNNPEELPLVLKRLEALLARDYQNAALRASVGDMHLRADREEDAIQQFTLVIETDPRGGRQVAERVGEYLKEKGDTPGLRWVLVSALMAAGDDAGALSAMRPLVEAGALLDNVVPALERLGDAGRDKSGQARLLLASALSRRGQAGMAVDILLAVAEEKGMPAIRQPLEELAGQQPASARVFHLLADVQVADGRAAEAVDSLRKARALAPQEESLLIPRLIKILDADPSAADAHLLLGELLLKSGERERGIVILRHLVREAPASSEPTLELFALVLKDDPRAARAHIGAAEACLALGRFPEGMQHLREVASSHPEFAAEFLRPLRLLAEDAPDQAAAVAEVLRGLETRTPLPHAVRFALGEVLIAAGQPAAAGAIFRELLKTVPERTEEIRGALERFDRDSPEAAEARVLLATLCLDRRDFKGALAEISRGGAASPALLEPLIARYDDIVGRSPEDIEARLGLVETLLLARRHDRVLAAAAETLKLKDDESTARVSQAMGDALREKGDSGAAVKRYFAAYGRNHSLGAGVIDRLKSLIQSEGAHSLGSLALGKVLASEGRPAEAVEALVAARSTDPKLTETVVTELQRLKDAFPADPQAGLALLPILCETGDLKRAVQLVSALLDARPDVASVLAGHLDRILKTDPKQAFATFELGRALQSLKLWQKSAASYLQAFKLDPNLGPLALRRLQESIDAAPASPDPYLAACAIHAARGKHQAAAEKIEQALAKLPGEAERLLPRLEEIQRQNKGSGPIALLYADSCLRAGRPDKALAAFGEAVRRDPSLADKAMAGIESVVQGDPQMAEAYLWRARFQAHRMLIDEALADLQEAVRLKPELGPEIIAEAESLRGRAPESHGCAMLLADHYAATGKEADAIRILGEQVERSAGRSERLAILVRLWRLQTAAGDDEAAQKHLAEASRLAADKNQFLQRVHESHLAVLRAAAARRRASVAGGARRAADLQEMIRLLVDLGEIREATKLLDRHAPQIGAEIASGLRAEIALRNGDYGRAAEHLMRLGASRPLAFAAARAGDHALAVKTLEALARDGAEAGIDTALARAYREMVAADLMGGRRRLLGETILTFGEGAAS